MDVDAVADLELVPDDFEEGEYEKLDKEIHGAGVEITPANVHLILPLVVQQSGDHVRPEYVKAAKCRILLTNNLGIFNALVAGSKNGYKDVQLLKLLQPEPASKVVQCSKHEAFAAEHGWEEKYVGNAVDALWDHIEAWFRKGHETRSSRRFYVKYSAIVQSSGMGKSRIVDEMSRFHFVIPINLWQPASTGYPPGDNLAYEYLVGRGSQREAFLRSCSFLHALFSQTASVVRGFKEGCAAEQFRDFMKKGMQVWVHGECRSKFYADVESEAKDLYRTTYSTYFCNDQLSPSHSAVDELLSDEKCPLRIAFQTLSKAIKDSGEVANPLPKQQKRKSKEEKDSESQLTHHPFVVLAFNEIHTLTKPSDDGSWSRFGEVRRAIRGLMNESLFTLFLSTSGTLFTITPTPEHDISGRMISTGEVMLPFYELGFDQLAVGVNFSKTVKLSQVTSEEHFTSYGRPLWRRYYQSQYQNQIISFAAFKLLGGTTYAGQTLTDHQKLACLAQRIPIEFLSALYVSQISDLEKEQVNFHMRVVLKVDGLETMVTTSPSEPVLSEAAYFIMSTNASFNPPQALQAILDGFAVHKGELGELVVALLFTIAHNKAVGSTDDFGSPPNKQRWCGIIGLLNSLFRTPRSASENHVDVIASHGWRFTPKGTESLKSSLADQFKDSKVYFTHFIKVHQHALVGVEFLMCLMVQGAAILSRNSQAGLDGIIPFLFEGDEIRRDNIGAIIFQVKNDSSYTDTQQPHLLRHMNPRALRIISASDDIPVIRFVFALSANTPTLQLVHHCKSLDATANGYSAYDFWISGLSPDLLDPVVNRKATWDSILQASCRWEKIYSGGSSLSMSLHKSMNPGVACNKDFWKNWCEDIPR